MWNIANWYCTNEKLLYTFHPLKNYFLPDLFKFFFPFSFIFTIFFSLPFLFFFFPFLSAPVFIKPNRWVGGSIWSHSGGASAWVLAWRSYGVGLGLHRSWPGVAVLDDLGLSLGFCTADLSLGWWSRDGLVLLI